MSPGAIFFISLSNAPRLVAAFTLVALTISSSAATISIDGAQQFQTVEGFGVNANHRSWNHNELQPVLDALIDQGGMSLFRVIYDKTDWETANDNNDPKLINWSYYNQVYSAPDFQKLWDLAAYLNQKGITDGMLFNFQGIGPDWMGGSSLTPGLEDEWAEMIASFLIYARNTQHLQFTLVGPDNEPDINTQGISMSPNQYVTALRKLAQLLDSNGLRNVRFIGPDLVSSSANWFSTMMGDATVMAKVAHFGLHSYSDNGGGSDGLSDFLQHSPYPDRTFWMTEFNVWCDICESAQGGTNSWDYASSAARYLLYHLANGASAGLVWEGYDSQYNYYSPGQWSYWGLFAVDDINAVPKTYTPRKIFYTLAQIAKFVRPGAKRIGTTGSLGSLLLVPFFHPGSGQLTLVGINSDINETALTGTLSNLPPVTNLDLYYTDAATNLLHSQTVQVTNGGFTATIPADCVFALVGSISGPSPPGAYVPRKGFYNGLFYTTDRTAARSSGFCAINTTAKGRFTGRLLLGSARHSLSGLLDSGGRAHLNIPRRNLAPLTVDLQIDSTSDSDSITGTVSDGTWTANLLARRATFDGKMTVAPQAGQYTFVFQGSRDSTTTPAGDSYGTASVDKAGKARLTCWLADGARANQSVSLSGAGEFPLYLSLYGRNGFVSGWLNVTKTPQDDLNGTVSWSKPTTPKRKFYPNGFSIETSASGSRYQRPPKGEKMLNLSGAEIVLAGAGLKAGITNEIALNTGNRISNFGNNKLNLAFNPSSGLFKGSATQPALLKPIQFNGVILQTQNVGRGFFLDRDESGEVFIGGTSSP